MARTTLAGASGSCERRASATGVLPRDRMGLQSLDFHGYVTPHTRPYARCMHVISGARARARGRRASGHGRNATGEWARVRGRILRAVATRSGRGYGCV